MLEPRKVQARDPHPFYPGEQISLSLVDVLVWQEVMQYLPFKLKDGFQKDVDVKNMIGDVKYQFTQGTFDVYTYGVYNSILKLVPSTPR